MFVEFTVDDSALLDEVENAADDIDRHEDLLELWSELGILVFDGDLWRQSKIFQAVKKLPVEIRRLWQQYYKVYSARTRGSHDLSQFLNAKTETPITRIAREVGVIFCGNELSSFYFSQPKVKAKVIDDVELVRFRSCRRSQIFKDVRELRIREIPANTTTEDIWRERFRPVAELCSHIRFVDGWAIKNCFENPSKPGLKAFIDKLGALERNFDIEIYAADWGYSESEIEFLLSKLLAGFDDRYIRSLEVYVVDKDIFRSVRHSRYIRFDRFICETDKGVAILDGEELRMPSTYVLKSIEPTHRKTEMDLRFHGSRLVIK